MIDVPIVIGNTKAFARIEEPLPDSIWDLEYQILDGQKEPSKELANTLADTGRFFSVEEQIKEQLYDN